MAVKVKVSGQVVVGDNRSNWHEPYEKEVLLATDVREEGVLRSMIRRGLISDVLRKEVKGYKRVRTMNVVSVEETKEEVKETELTKLLGECVKKGCVPEMLDQFESEDSKIDALKRALAAKERGGRKAQKEKGVVSEGYVE